VEDNLQTAVRKMTTAAVTALIVESGGELVGIVTDMDIMHSVAASRNPTELKVADFMTACELITREGAKTPCIQLDEDQSIKSALEIMDEAGVHNLLVSGADGKVAGMVSASDLLKVAVL